MKIISFKNIAVVAVLALFCGGAVAYADFIRTTGPIGWGYGYGYDTDTLEYGYGYGYNQSDPDPESRELYGFPGDDGAVTDISVDVACDSAVVTYTSDYLAEHRVAYGLVSPGDIDSTEWTDFESGENTITLADLDESTTYVFVVGSRDVDGGLWPSDQDSFETTACSSGPSSSGSRVHPKNNTDQTDIPDADTRVLRKGMFGLDVFNLQKFLNNHGFPVRNIPLLGSLGHETWFFGPHTRAAVIRFQIANGLAPDGVVGPLTNAVIQKILNPVQ